MRKLLNVNLDGLSLLQPELPTPTPSPPTITPFVIPDFTAHIFSSATVSRNVFDVTALCFISALLILSSVAIAFIFYLRLRSQRLQHLENFNSIWTVRLLLVSLASVWAANEVLRLPFVRKHYLYPFELTLVEQANICKLHVVLSLGFFEPGFLITLLFLVNVSIKKRKPSRLWALVFLLMICFPLTLLQLFFVVFTPFEGKMPKFLHGSFVLGDDVYGAKTVLCVYPFFSCVIFGGFTIAYSMAFLLSCWRVMAFVINKGIRMRINILAATVMVALSVQVACLSLSWLWMPEEGAYGFVVLAMFLFVTGCMAVGEIILVLKPIKDALAADAELQRRATTGETEYGPCRS
ncbi:uncharacterized protein LOC105166924 [Sesamum indicum]|uniref:Uncharacterized protein LOC105166924 n=1 Tax=Sesamum indicum TaxID=4182 RepID=A0A6I9TU05_SESIN|nr:uncharacterized protein LOC105166924 [Sesamum indicum]